MRPAAEANNCRPIAPTAQGGSGDQLMAPPFDGPLVRRDYDDDAKHRPACRQLGPVRRLFGLLMPASDANKSSKQLAPTNDEEERQGFLAMVKRNGSAGGAEQTNRGASLGSGGAKTPAASSRGGADREAAARGTAAPPSASVSANTSGKAKLARQETIEEAAAAAAAAAEAGRQQNVAQLTGGGGKTKQTKADRGKKRKSANKNKNKSNPDSPGDAKAFAKKQATKDQESCSPIRRMLNAIKCKRCYVPILLILVYVTVIYCVPYLEFEPKTLEPWPRVAFNYRDGPLKASSAGQFKVEQLFRGQISGAESISLDSQGNMYLAIEGGFILYAHLNKSSPIKKHYYDAQQLRSILASQSGADDPQHPTNNNHHQLPDLIKIADLNAPIRQQQQRTQRQQQDTSGGLRRECQLDEQVYGPQLFAYSTDDNSQPEQQQQQETNEVDTKPNRFSTRVIQSRCSKPLGTRLSPDEQYLYVVDTMAGLYRVNLRVAERAHSTQRQVARLIDFRVNHYLPIVQLDSVATSGDIDASRRRMSAAPSRVAQAPQQQQQQQDQNQDNDNADYYWQNVSLKAVDDLVIDYGSGSRGGDLIYLTVGSLNWPAISFVYQLLEGRPSGLLLCYDTGLNQLFVLDPIRMAHVRTTSMLTSDGYSIQLDNANDMIQPPPPQEQQQQQQAAASQPTPTTYGKPKLDENDIFDDRPLNFPNGIELMDDRQALLIADTGNKRIIKHYVRGPRRGTSDLWAWTPQFPDNIRRGYDKQRETYWVVGCGRDDSRNQLYVDPMVLLRPWPRIRKFLAKNIYLFGLLTEWFGSKIFNSISVTDIGHSIKTGYTFCESACTGMMVLQYNKQGELIRSIHSREFPNDLAYYSQVNELIDANQQEHSLYLSSPSYKYVTKLILPTESYPMPPEHLLANNGGFG